MKKKTNIQQDIESRLKIANNLNPAILPPKQEENAESETIQGAQADQNSGLDAQEPKKARRKAKGNA